MHTWPLGATAAISAAAGLSCHGDGKECHLQGLARCPRNRAGLILVCALMIVSRLQHLGGEGECKRVVQIQSK